MADTDALADRDIIARTLDGEAGDQSFLGIQGVACVILRRTLLKWQGETTARGVVLHPEQFSCWNPGPDRDRIMKRGYVAPNACLILADVIIEQLLTDTVKGADSYDVIGTDAYWEKGLEPVCTIGKHQFWITRKLPVTRNGSDVAVNPVQKT